MEALLMRGEKERRYRLKAVPLTFTLGRIKRGLFQDSSFRFPFQLTGAKMMSFKKMPRLVWGLAGD